MTQSFELTNNVLVIIPEMLVGESAASKFFEKLNDKYSSFKVKLERETIQPNTVLDGMDAFAVKHRVRMLTDRRRTDFVAIDADGTVYVYLKRNGTQILEYLFRYDKGIVTLSSKFGKDIIQWMTTPQCRARLASAIRSADPRLSKPQSVERNIGRYLTDICHAESVPGTTNVFAIDSASTKAFKYLINAMDSYALPSLMVQNIQKITDKQLQSLMTVAARLKDMKVFVEKYERWNRDSGKLQDPSTHIPESVKELKLAHRDMLDSIMEDYKELQKLLEYQRRFEQKETSKAFGMAFTNL